MDEDRDLLLADGTLLRTPDGFAERVMARVWLQPLPGRHAGLLARLNALKPALAVDAVTVIADDALTNPKSDLLDVRLEASAPFVPAR